MKALNLADDKSHKVMISFVVTTYYLQFKLGSRYKVAFRLLKIKRNKTKELLSREDK